MMAMMWWWYWWVGIDEEKRNWLADIDQYMMVDVNGSRCEWWLVKYSDVCSNWWLLVITIIYSVKRWYYYWLTYCVEKMMMVKESDDDSDGKQYCEKWDDGKHYERSVMMTEETDEEKTDRCESGIKLIWWTDGKIDYWVMMCGVTDRYCWATIGRDVCWPGADDVTLTTVIVVTVFWWKCDDLYCSYWRWYSLTVWLMVKSYGIENWRLMMKRRYLNDDQLVNGNWCVVEPIVDDVCGGWRYYTTGRWQLTVCGRIDDDDYWWWWSGMTM